MATLQRLPHSSSCSTTSSYGTNSGKPKTFPAGLRVLVVDDDITCSRILEQMLRRCSYQATTCSQVTVALNLLRERKGCFDLVLSDVHMPDMDGFKLLELVGLEMDLPVISSLDDNDRHKRGSDDAEYASSVNEGSEGILKTLKRGEILKKKMMLNWKMMTPVHQRSHV